MLPLWGGCRRAQEAINADLGAFALLSRSSVSQELQSGAIPPRRGGTFLHVWGWEARLGLGEAGRREDPWPTLEVVASLRRDLLHHQPGAWFPHRLIDLKPAFP